MHILVDQGFVSSHKLHRYNKLSAETVRQFYDHHGNHSTFHMAGFFFFFFILFFWKESKNTNAPKESILVVVKLNSCPVKNLRRKNSQNCRRGGCCFSYLGFFVFFFLNRISRSAGSFKLWTIIVGDPAGSQGKKRQHLKKKKSTEASLQRCRAQGEHR